MTPRQIIPALVAVAAAATLLAGCGGSDSSDGNASSPPKSSSAPADPASGASGSAVTISGFKFAPTSLTVKRDAKVTVTNDDSTAHTATADDGNTFDTGTLDPGSSQNDQRRQAGQLRLPLQHPSVHEGHDRRPMSSAGPRGGAAVARCTLEGFSAGGYQRPEASSRSRT